MDFNLYFNKYRRNFSVELDVNLGEFDRINQKLGKLSASFNISISKKLVNYLVRSLKNSSREKLENFLSKAIKEQVEKKGVFKNKGLEYLIASTLLEQFELVGEKIYKSNESGKLVVPIKINFGLFALKYLRDQSLK